MQMIASPFEKKIDTLKAIAKEAGEIVREGYHAAKSVQYKGLVDLVTQYDVRVEEFVMARLREGFGEYTLIGEESFVASTDTASHPHKAIYIDPIDGTTNFVHGLPHLAISIGVWEEGSPLMAVVYNPILEELFWAVRGEGAYCGEARLGVSSQESLQQSLIATGFPYAKVNRGREYEWVIEVFTVLLPSIRDIRRLGAAALDLCYTAQGRVDGFYEIDLKPWDVSAGILILLEAGGKVTNLSGEPFTFGDKGVVATNTKIHEALLEKLPRY